MFFRRKKSEGFDWHQYVRTTIKLRRDQRRAKLEDIGRVAAQQAKSAGDAAVQGVAQAAGTGWRASVAAWRNTIAQPSIALPATLCGAVAAASGGHRLATIGADRDALIPLVLGGVLLLAVAPLAIARMMRGPGNMPSLPNLKSLSIPTSLIPAAAIGGSVLALGWFAWPWRPNHSGASSQSRWRGQHARRARNGALRRDDSPARTLTSSVRHRSAGSAANVSQGLKTALEMRGSRNTSPRTDRALKNLPLCHSRRT
jgi:hypothetical protein